MMKMKLTNTRLLILMVGLLALAMCCGVAGFAVVEGLANQKQKHEDEDAAEDDEVNLRRTAEMANPRGIPKSEIPEGQEDLYILKSQVVPPVCPACPESSSLPREKPCPACPPCARCPEPAFECKKVPNYDSAAAPQFLPSSPFMAETDSRSASGYISRSQGQPRPMLTDFSGF
jgi:hypothetical protein